MSIFSKKNLNLIVGLITLLLLLWIVMYAVPSLFVSLFNTFLGNMILFGFILLSGMYEPKLGLGLAVVFIILYQFAHLSKNK
jgi:hypothetical protein